MLGISGVMIYVEACPNSTLKTTATYTISEKLEK